MTDQTYYEDVPDVGLLLSAHGSALDMENDHRLDSDERELGFMIVTPSKMSHPSLILRGTDYELAEFARRILAAVTPADEPRVRKI